MSTYVYIYIGVHTSVYIDIENLTCSTLHDVLWYSTLHYVTLLHYASMWCDSMFCYVH